MGIAHAGEADEDIACTNFNKERALLVWIVANKERVIDRPKGFFSEDELAREFLPAARERRAIMITYGKDREEVKRRAAPELGGNPDHYIVEPLSNEEDRVLIKLQFDQEGG